MTPTDRFRALLARLAEPAGDAVAAAGSHRGARADNQDCAGVARLGDRLVAFVADGMGGSPDGGRAALSACCHAFLEIRRALSRDGSFRSGAALRAVADAFDAAAQHVGHEARRRLYGPARPGYGTTLVVVIADAARYVYGWLGDGALVLRRADGHVLDLLKAQRRLGARSILEGSLGPVPCGEPEFGVAARAPGDLLLAGTDGLFDIAPPTRFVEQYHARLNGSVTQAVHAALAEVAQAADADGPVCDDNLSLVAIRTVGGAP